MKYRVIKGNEEIIVILEDGGVACIRDVYAEDYKTVSDYYQDRFTQEMLDNENIWEELGEGKMYCAEWQVPFDSPELVQEALNWLCVWEDNFEVDESIWKDFKG